MDFITILSDQKEEIESLPFDTYTQRERLSLIETESHLAQVVIGVRRCGKSTLCLQALRCTGKSFAYINFDDEVLGSISASQLNDVLAAAYVVYGEFKHILLDEIQNIEGWELFVNRLLRKGFHVLVTGSNAKLLSGELATHLTGRHKLIELMPFTFSEYRRSIGKVVKSPVLSTRDKANVDSAYQSFSRKGGLPETLLLPDARSYLRTLYDAIVYKDIIRRYNIRVPQALARLSSILLQNICHEVNCAALAAELNVGSVHTIQNYIKYLQNAYMIMTLPKYSTKPTLRGASYKAYAVDLGFVTSHTGVDFQGDDLGWRLENLVFLKLHAHRLEENYEMHYWKNGHEVDFLIEQGGRVTRLVQASWSIASARTRKREVDALLAASKKLKCHDLYIVTFNGAEVIEADGERISVVPVRDWL